LSWGGALRFVQSMQAALMGAAGVILNVLVQPIALTLIVVFVSLCENCFFQV
jgi:hypothetical protein